MPRVPVHTLDDAPEQTRPTLEALSKRMGKLLNIHAEMAHSPVVLGAYAGMQEAIARHGTFDGRTREAIALAVGAVDHCGYCQSAHTLGGKAAGLDPERMLAIRAGRPTGDDRLDTLLAVMREAAGEVGTVQDDTWKQAQAAGWSEEELGEGFAHLAVNLFTNYFNHYMRTELDLPPAPALDA
ncbi:carboxymuconolactone decarboxylase family protein [Pseudonocardia nigra]|uniref:carboxymuconolactone decarboxylase family protein n=1 Tax=Pseudonocardia nigra TaxID=1921578 RepID=UPI001C5D84EF|nr:carboxymuconolactone decarboxylase family protein [Pseudonocardia nigra]